MNKITKIKKISNFLNSKYNTESPIFISEVYNEFPDMSTNTIRTIFKRLTDDNVIDRIDDGIYALYNEDSVLKKPIVYSSNIINEKYLLKNNKINGYISGINFANKLGLTFQTASIETVYSNNTSNKNRTITIKGRKIQLRAPRVKISEKNFKLLQILDLLNNFESYSEYSLIESKEKILNYLQGISFLEEELDFIVSKYPLKAQVRFYKLGVHYAVTRR